MGGAGGGANAAELEELNNLWREKAMRITFPLGTSEEIVKKDLEDKKKFREDFYEKLLENKTLKNKEWLYEDLKYYLGVTINEDRDHVKDLSETIEWLQRIIRNGNSLFTEEEIATIRGIMKSLLVSQEGGRRRRSKRNTRRRRTTRRRRSSQRR